MRHRQDAPVQQPTPQQRRFPPSAPQTPLPPPRAPSLSPLARLCCRRRVVAVLCTSNDAADRSRPSPRPTQPTLGGAARLSGRAGRPRPIRCDCGGGEPRGVAQRGGGGGAVGASQTGGRTDTAASQTARSPVCTDASAGGTAHTCAHRGRGERGEEERAGEYGIAHKWAAGEARSSARCGSSENGRARRRRQGHQANATTQRLQGRAQRPPACSQRASGSTRAARRAPPYPPPPPGEARTPLSHAAERGGDPASKQPASKERAAPAPGVQA